jgi:proteasome accessory factor C
MKQLAFALDVSEKTAYRYKDTLCELGFRLERNDYSHQYKIVDKVPMDLNLAFSQEEVDFIMSNLPKGSDLTPGISNKLYIHSDILSVPGALQEIGFGKAVKSLQRAIEKKKRVILKDYSSANSNEQRDILAEPVKLEDHYRRLYAFCPERKKIMQYKTERIGEVKITSGKQFYTLHNTGDIETDPFWWVFENDRYKVTLDMNMGVYHMVREDYPRIETYVTELDENRYRLETEVANLAPVSSLILRFPEGVQNVEPDELKSYTIGRLKYSPFWNDLPGYFLK